MRLETESPATICGPSPRPHPCIGAARQVDSVEPVTVAGEVVGVSAADTTGKVTISVELPVGQAPEVAVWAATGNAAGMLESREG